MKLNQLSVTEIKRLSKTYCKHRVNLISHFSCYKKEEPQRVLFLDIEITPALGWTWQKYETDIIEFEKQWRVLCVGYKWQGGKTEIVWGNERKVIKKIRDLLDEADLAIGHNSDKFDLKKINTRIAYYNLKPPSKYKTLDTLKMAKKYWGMLSNKLNDIGIYMNLGKKIETGGFKLWKDCMAGNKKSWKLMTDYCKQDVDLLEKLYLKLLPWLPQKK